MEKAKQTWYFLGANSPTGFTSLYDGFVDQESDQLYILKGGPGCGKSSFMRVVASDMESAGFAAEYIQCSGDPDSLDGVYFPELNVAFADGTAPHVMEPKYPGITASYINLGRFYDTAALSAYREMIVLLHAEYKHLYDAAYKYIQASQLVSQELRDSLASRKLYGKMEKKAQSLCRREFGTPAAGSGKIKMRFLDAWITEDAGR